MGVWCTGPHTAGATADLVASCAHLQSLKAGLKPSHSQLLAPGVPQFQIPQKRVPHLYHLSISPPRPSPQSTWHSQHTWQDFAPAEVSVTSTRPPTGPRLGSVGTQPEARLRGSRVGSALSCLASAYCPPSLPSCCSTSPPPIASSSSGLLTSEKMFVSNKNTIVTVRTASYELFYKVFKTKQGLPAFIRSSSYSVSKLSGMIFKN